MMSPLLLLLLLLLGKGLLRLRGSVVVLREWLREWREEEL
jgi:hypothetical protein